MELIQELEAAIQRSIENTVKRQLEASIAPFVDSRIQTYMASSMGITIEETWAQSLSDAFERRVEMLSKVAENSGAARHKEMLDSLREVDDAGTLTPLAKLIDSRIAHFLDASLKTPLSSTTPEQVMEIVNNRLAQWEADDFETEVEAMIERRIDTHIEADGHLGDEDVESAVIDAINTRAVEREIETKIRDMITGDLTFRVTVD